MIRRLDYYVLACLASVFGGLAMLYRPPLSWLFWALSVFSVVVIAARIPQRSGGAARAKPRSSSSHPAPNAEAERSAEPVPIAFPSVQVRFRGTRYELPLNGEEVDVAGEFMLTASTTPQKHYEIGLFLKREGWRREFVATRSDEDPQVACTAVEQTFEAIGEDYLRLRDVEG